MYNQGYGAYGQWGQGSDFTQQGYYQNGYYNNQSNQSRPPHMPGPVQHHRQPNGSQSGFQQQHNHKGPPLSPNKGNHNHQKMHRKNDMHGQQQQKNRPNTTTLEIDTMMQLYAPLSHTESTKSAVHTQVSEEIIDMVEDLTPTRESVALRAILLQLVAQAVKDALPEYQSAQVLPFGSYISGLGTIDSDLDVVVVGAMQPGDVSQGFYSKHERPACALLLDRVNRVLRRCQGLTIKNLFIIRSSRIPLSKLTACVNVRQLSQHLGALLPKGFSGSSQAVSIDISIATPSGPEAGQYLAQQSAHFPALRPLSLAVKSFLKNKDMNEVASGGLSSYGLSYCIIALLLEEQAAGTNMQDLGWLLHRFFSRYGQEFSTYTHAVSVKHGGIQARSKIPGMRFTNMDRLCVLDPLTGRDITEGAYRSQEVLGVFKLAALYLDAHYKAAQSATRKQHSTKSILRGLIDLTPFYDDDDEYEEYAEDDNYVGGVNAVPAAAPAAKRQKSDTAQPLTGLGARYRPSLPGAPPPAPQLFPWTYPDAEEQAGNDDHVVFKHDHVSRPSSGAQGQQQKADAGGGGDSGSGSQDDPGAGRSKSMPNMVIRNRSGGGAGPGAAGGGGAGGGVHSVLGRKRSLQEALAAGSTRSAGR